MSYINADKLTNHIRANRKQFEYYILANKELVMREEPHQSIPLTFVNDYDAKEWCDLMNEKLPDKHFIYFGTLNEINVNN